MFEDDELFTFRQPILVCSLNTSLELEYELRSASTLDFEEWIELIDLNTE